MGHNQALGARGEALAAQWYAERGYEVLARNWRCRDGELDLILCRRRTVVFCEVKTRTTVAFGHPAEAVTPHKQQRIRRLALQYLQASRLAPTEIRFDVVAVLGGSLEVFPSAF